MLIKSVQSRYQSPKGQIINFLNEGFSNFSKPLKKDDPLLRDPLQLYILMYKDPFIL